MVVHCPLQARDKPDELPWFDSELEDAVLDPQTMPFAQARNLPEPALARWRCRVDIVGYEVTGQPRLTRGGCTSRDRRGSPSRGSSLGHGVRAGRVGSLGAQPLSSLVRFVLANSR